jgi:dimethylargininase
LIGETHRGEHAHHHDDPDPTVGDDDRHAHREPIALTCASLQAVPRILVRRPSPRLAAGELTHLERLPVDAELALEQWHGYVDAFRDHGWDVTTVEPADEHPDGVFVEDAVVVFDDLAVLTSPGADSRRGELATVAPVVDELGLAIHHIEPPGTLDGGDVLKVGRIAYVGRSARTNDAGIDQLARLLAPAGWRVVAVPVTRALHLKSAVTALPDGAVIGRAELIDDTAFPDFEHVPEPHGIAVVDLGDDTIVMSAAAPQTASLFRDRGYAVVPVAISEFEKLEGCVTCLSVRIRASAASTRRGE